MSENNDDTFGPKCWTREKIKKVLPIMQAYAEGKDIQFKVHSSWKEVIGGEWEDCGEKTFFYSDTEYRIKPTPTYIPFETSEECLEEMKKHEPFGWVKSIDGNYFCPSIGESGVHGYTFEMSLFKLRFLDEHPFGKLKKE